MVYGNFIQSVVNFLLIALVIFSVIKAKNGGRRSAFAAHWSCCTCCGNGWN